MAGVLALATRGISPIPAASNRQMGSPVPHSEHPAQSPSRGPDGWPDGVRPVSERGLDRLGVDEEGKLYWQGRPVELKRGISFTKPQTLFGAASLVAAVIAAGATAVSAYSDYQQLQISRATAGQE